VTAAVGLALAAAALIGASPAASIAFQPAHDYGVGFAPSGIAVGDLNADGNPDAVVVNRDSDDLTILLGDGIGGFKSQATASTGPGTQPVAVAIADFNGDARQDVVVANQGTDQIAVLLGSGDGVLGPPGTYALSPGSLPSALAVGDFNFDQRPDVAVADQGTGVVSVFLSNMGGGLGLEDVFAGTPIRRQSARGIVTADFNGDGKLDLALASAGGNVAHLLGVRVGAFEVAVAILTVPGSLTSGIASGDLNGDNRADLVVVNQGSNTVPVLTGDGAANFSVTANPTVGGGPTAVALGDLDRDGKLDVAVANLFSGTVATMAGDGAGGLGAPEQFPVGASPDAIAIADMNRDGFPDILVANNGSNSVSVLLNRIPTTAPPPTPPTDLSVALTDAPDPVTLGGTVAYTATVTNIGTVPANGVTLTGTLSAAATLVSATAAQGSCAPIAPGLRCDLGALAAGASTTVSVVVRPGTAGQISTAVSAAAPGLADPSPANNDASVLTTVAPAPPAPFAATLSLPTSVALGRRTALVGTMRCNRACRVTATVAVATRPAARPAVPRVRVRVTPARGSRITVRLDLRAARPAILAALRRGARVTLNVDVRARDAANTTKRVRRAVRLRR
jgi:uncharacterized repeat protein (TIGR01451 family)